MFWDDRRQTSQNLIVRFWIGCVLLQFKKYICQISSKQLETFVGGYRHTPFNFHFPDTWVASLRNRITDVQRNCKFCRGYFLSPSPYFVYFNRDTFRTSCLKLLWKPLRNMECWRVIIQSRVYSINAFGSIFFVTEVENIWLLISVRRVKYLVTEIL